MKIIAFFLIFGIGVFCALVTWRISGFFLSRRDYYVNSQYELLKKKLSMSVTAAIVPFVISFFLFPGLYKKKTENQNQNKHILYKQPDITSEILYEGKAVIKVTDSTKYFYRVNFVENGISKSVYLLK